MCPWGLFTSGAMGTARAGAQPRREELHPLKRAKIRERGKGGKKTCNDVAACVTHPGEFLCGLMDLNQTSLLIPVVSVFARGPVSSGLEETTS